MGSIDWGDVLRGALSFFLVVVGLGIAYVCVRVGGLLRRLTGTVGQMTDEVVPILSRAQTTVDGINLELVRVDDIMVSAVNATKGAEKTVTTLSGAVTSPVRKASGLAAAAKEAFATFRTRRTAGPNEAEEAFATATAASAAPVADPAPARDATPPSPPAAPLPDDHASAFRAAASAGGERFRDAVATTQERARSAAAAAAAAAGPADPEPLSPPPVSASLPPAATPAPPAPVDEPSPAVAAAGEDVFARHVSDAAPAPSPPAAAPAPSPPAAAPAPPAAPPTPLPTVAPGEDVFARHVRTPAAAATAASTTAAPAAVAPPRPVPAPPAGADVFDRHVRTTTPPASPAVAPPPESDRDVPATVHRIENVFDRHVRVEPIAGGSPDLDDQPTQPIPRIEIDDLDLPTDVLDGRRRGPSRSQIAWALPRHTE